jgi:hypothetical protein
MSVQTPVEAVVLTAFLIVWSVVSLLLVLDYRGWLERFTARSARWQGFSIGFYRVGFAIGLAAGIAALVAEIAGVATGTVG